MTEYIVKTTYGRQMKISVEESVLADWQAQGIDPEKALITSMATRMRMPEKSISIKPMIPVAMTVKNSEDSMET